ncbi:hypothetical protein MMC19_007047 [Ptychographa xylographoides]|nr:hypothetical protein [Ptychographa xylographoides]
MPEPEPIPEWEIEEGLPQFTDPFIQKYLSGRIAIIDQEKSTRSDAAFRSSLTPLANEACAIVSRIRAEERETIWTKDAELDGHVFPGMPFALARNRMEESKLWGIVQRMPKGALLHAHFDAMIEVEWLVEQALAIEGMGFRASEGLCSEAALETAAVDFTFMGTASEKQGTSVEASSIWASSYTPKKCISVTEAADSFPSGGRQGFRDWLSRRMTITSSESIDHHKGLDVIWQKFTSCFPIIGSILFYEPVFRASVQRLLTELLLDGIRWVDFRAAFIFDYYRTGQTQPEVGYDALFVAFREELEKFQATEHGTRFWGARFIWTTLRPHSRRQIVENMKLCIATKVHFPDLISGFDLVGQEDLGRPLVDLTPEIFWFRKRCVEAGVEIPFFFHAGECLGDGDGTDENLFDAILLGTRRIGHGFSLFKHPLLIEMVKQKSILIESCPISNEILRLTNSIMSHPLPALLARGVKVALCNDDPAILGHGKNGLTHDFWQALQAWENLGLEGLGSLAENSVRFAAFGPDQGTAEWMKDVKDGIYGTGIRGDRMREWVGDWNRFCEWIVMEFAGEYGGDDDEDRGDEEDLEQEDEHDDSDI